MAFEQRAEVDGDELVAVQRVDVTALAPLARGELDPAAAAEPLWLLRDDDLGAEPRQLLLEQRPLSCGARHDHARYARTGEATHLVRRERTPRDVDEGLRLSARCVAEPLGLAAGEKDPFHRSG